MFVGPCLFACDVRVRATLASPSAYCSSYTQHNSNNNLDPRSNVNNTTATVAAARSHMSYTQLHTAHGIALTRGRVFSSLLSSLFWYVQAQTRSLLLVERLQLPPPLRFHLLDIINSNITLLPLLVSFCILLLLLLFFCVVVVIIICLFSLTLCCLFYVPQILLMSNSSKAARHHHSSTAHPPPHQHPLVELLLAITTL